MTQKHQYTPEMGARRRNSGGTMQGTTAPIYVHIPEMGARRRKNGGTMEDTTTPIYT